MRRHGKVLAYVLAVATLLPAVITGCSQSKPSDPVALGIAALATGGVTVYESFDAKTPISRPDGRLSAMRVTRFQLRNMIAQASSGMGMTGAVLDSFSRKTIPARSPNISAFIAAWLKRGQGPLAMYAADFMPKNADYTHPERLTFPLLVVTLFIADVARLSPDAPRPSPSTGFEWDNFFATPASAALGCSTVTDFVSSVVDNVKSALQVSGDGLIATLWNVVVEIVVDAAVGTMKAALAPLFSAIIAVASALAMVTTIASALQPWSLTVDPEPATVTMQAAGINGKFTANLKAESIDWPAGLKDCAQSLAGIDLESISYKDAPVSWETTGGIPADASIIDTQSTIKADKKATLTYRTHPLEDEPKAECSSPHSRSSIEAYATVERADVQKLQGVLAKTALSALPNVVQKYVTPLLQPWIDAELHAVTNLLAAPVSAVGTAQLEAPQLDRAKCSPAPQPSTALATPTSAGVNAVLGHWKCVINQKVEAEGIALNIDVHVNMTFGADGVANTQFPSGSSGTFGAKSVDVQANQNMVDAGPGSYSYTAQSANSGVLHMAQESRASDWHLIFSGHNAFSTILPGQQGGKALPLQCNRG